MSDIREALVARQRDEYSASWDVLVPEVGWTLGRVVESTIEDVLAEFDVTPRGEGEQLFERDDSCGYCGRVHSDFAACFEDAPGATWHDHEWQRRQNVTSSGYRMPPYEVCVVDGCDAARPVEEPGACGHPNHGASGHDCRPFRPAPPSVKPSVEDVAAAIETETAAYDPVTSPERGEPESLLAADGSDMSLSAARAVLALLPGRSEAEVKAEALREAAIYAPGGPVVSGWLRERADQWEETNRG